MLLAFSAKPEELEVLLLSITFGNIDVQRSAYRSLIHSLNVKLSVLMLKSVLLQLSSQHHHVISFY